jgi:3D (Asp-Asp-Asp) domain-containing protein
MQMEKPSTNQKRLTLFRLIVGIASIGLIMHMTHRECARMADNPPATAYDGIISGPAEVFHATAYCLTGTTRSGVPAAPGLVAADPNVIPLGSMIYVDSPLMNGIYQVLDTGDLIKGKIIDIFIPNYEKCMEFGRRVVKVKVLRYGFHNEKHGMAVRPAKEDQ